jgi:site-specific DNA-methyltransferase (cytosine-N4-specific)
VLLQVVSRHGGKYEPLVAAIRAAFFEEGSGSSYNKTKKADNTTLALRDYGILGKDKATLTPFGQDLLRLVDDPPRLYAAFARHILTRLNGLAVVRTIQDLQTAEREVTLETLPDALRMRGLRVPPTSTHISALKGWLREAGVFVGGRNSYEVDEATLRNLLGGLSARDLDALSALSELQRAFLKALARFPASEWSRSNEVAKLAQSLFAVRFPWKSLRSSVLDACKAAGFIEFKKTTSGRGAKPHLVRPTKKFNAEVLEPLLASYRDPVGTRLRDLLRTPIARVVEDLGAPDKHAKGKALELLALHLSFTAGLDFVDWRKRAAETGGAEVDVIVEDSRRMFTRWQIQCKNGPAHLEDVAKEIGLAVVLGSNVVLLLTTKKLSRDTRAFADAAMRRTNLQVLLADGTDLRRLVESPARMVEFLAEQANRAKRIKTSGGAPASSSAFSVAEEKPEPIPAKQFRPTPSVAEETERDEGPEENAP